MIARRLFIFVFALLSLSTAEDIFVPKVNNIFSLDSLSRRTRQSGKFQFKYDLNVYL